VNDVVTIKLAAFVGVSYYILLTKTGSDMDKPMTGMSLHYGKAKPYL
jgi:hypothetical protein